MRLRIAVPVGCWYLAIPQMRKNSIMLSKGQRMSEVVLDNQGSSGSTWRRSRVGLLLITAVVVALLCKPLPAQNAGGTASGSGGGGQASAAGSSGQATAQDNGAQASSAQGGNAQAPLPRVMMPRRPRRVAMRKAPRAELAMPKRLPRVEAPQAPSARMCNDPKATQPSGSPQRNPIGRQRPAGRWLPLQEPVVVTNPDDTPGDTATQSLWGFALAA